jgi:hypothetical protein
MSNERPLKAMMVRTTYERSLEIKRTAVRLNRSVAWVLGTAWELARKDFLGKKLAEIEAAAGTATTDGRRSGSSMTGHDA